MEKPLEHYVGVLLFTLICLVLALGWGLFVWWVVELIKKIFKK